MNLEIILSEGGPRRTWYEPTYVKHTEPANSWREKVDKKSLGTQAKGEGRLLVNMTFWGRMKILIS